MEQVPSTEKCRICYLEFTEGVDLFGEEAKRLFLQAKIKRYLSFTISLSDKLPKMVCEECCSKLDGFHKFATMALRNQEKMSKYMHANVGKCEKKETDNKSLLHSYLTKGVKDKDSESSESEITEMEVRVDPMAILQYCSGDEEDENNIENTQETASEKDDEESSDQESNSKTENLSECENLNNNKLISCQLCPRSFTSETALQMHMWGHPSQPKRILSFNNMQEKINQVVVTLESVKKIEDNGNNNNKCTDEDSEDTEDDEFDEFSEKKSSSPCPICGKLISNKGNLKVHLETHRPKGRYACDICGRIFKTQCNLYRHKEYHGGIQYPCVVCGRVYPTNSTLRAHSITHSDLRPHGCPMCDKTFKRNQDLKFHINQHTGARPYQCPYCPKAFASSGNCFSHRKRMHPLEVERDRERAAKIMR